ncbi:hypothetical protein C8J56DRAFT_1162241 [Mycena floridula]|nr:hypothetical protein C8J56DRAFT_1162241 [Mycena floridula]
MTFPSSSVAGRIPFPMPKPTSSPHSVQKKNTLISPPIPLTNSSNHDIKSRKRCDSTETIRARPTKIPPKPKAATKKRAREPDSAESLSDADAGPRTRQRVTSTSTGRIEGRIESTAFVEGILKHMAQQPSSVPQPKIRDVKDRLDIQPRIRLTSGSGPASLKVGRSIPAVAVLTQQAPVTAASKPQACLVELSKVPSNSAPPSPTIPTKIVAPSDHITRSNFPPIPTKWGSSHFPQMSAGLIEYHDRFRDAKLSKPRLSLSSNIIPPSLLPPRLVYERDEEEVDDFYYPYQVTPPLADHWGNIIDVSARHLDLSIGFSGKSPYIEMWDMDGLTHVGIPATIHFSLNDSCNLVQNCAIPPRPDFRCIDINCNSFDYNARQASSTVAPEYTVKYQGAVVTSRSMIHPETGLMNGIVIRKTWGKAFPVPGSDSDSDDEVPRDRKGWYLKIWVPVPVALFRTKESRAFRLKAAAWVGDEATGGIITAETDMVVSHLRSHREMA